MLPPVTLHHPGDPIGAKIDLQPNAAAPCGRPSLNSEKRLWAAHPCGFVFCKGGSFSSLFPRFSFLISIFQFGGATRFSVFETICDADVLPPGGEGGPASWRETRPRCRRRPPWV